MQKLTDRELKLLLHLRTLKPGDKVNGFQSPNLEQDFKNLKEKGFISNDIDNSVGIYKNYRFTISAKGIDLIDNLLKNN